MHHYIDTTAETLANGIMQVRQRRSLDNLTEEQWNHLLCELDIGWSSLDTLLDELAKMESEKA